MTTSDLDRFRSIAIDIMPHLEGKIEPNSRLVEDMDADSLDLLQLIVGIEDEWNIRASDDDLDSIATVSDALELIRERKPDAPAQAYAARIRRRHPNQTEQPVGTVVLAQATTSSVPTYRRLRFGMMPVHI